MTEGAPNLVDEATSSQEKNVFCGVRFWYCWTAGWIPAYLGELMTEDFHLCQKVRRTKVRPSKCQVFDIM